MLETVAGTALVRIRCVLGMINAARTRRGGGGPPGACLVRPAELCGADFDRTSQLRDFTSDRCAFESLSEQGDRSQPYLAGRCLVHGHEFVRAGATSEVIEVVANHAGGADSGIGEHVVDRAAAAGGQKLVGLLVGGLAVGVAAAAAELLAEKVDRSEP